LTPHKLSNLKRIVPSPLWRTARVFRDGLDAIVQWPAATLHPWRIRSKQKLANLKDIHKGERCFIIGNGPSLKDTDLHRLRNEYTIGMNRIYLLFPELGFTTSYFLSVNNLVIEQCVEEIRSLPIPKFISWRARALFQPTADTIFLFTTYTGPKFARDARDRLWEGATVTYTALQLAFHMGFSQVILIGVDHNFVTKGPPNMTVVSEGDDPNHFHTAYFGKGFRWQLPDLDTSERAYHMANEVYSISGRQVIDATVGGKLTVFQKVKFEDLF
jgi:hypothetical protein